MDQEPPTVQGWVDPEEDWWPVQREFAPVSFSDVPSVLLTQLFDGELSFDTMRRTFFSDESLTPAERDSYRDKLKAKFGGNRVADTTIDVVTNPLTWLMFLSAPIAVKAMRGGNHSLFTNWVAKGMAPLSSLGFLGLNQSVGNPKLNQVMIRMQEIMQGEQKALHYGVGKEAQDLLRAIERRYGVSLTSLNPAEAKGSKRAAAQAALLELETLVTGRLAGHDKPTGFIPTNIKLTDEFEAQGYLIDAVTGARGTTQVRVRVGVDDAEFLKREVDKAGVTEVNWTDPLTGDKYVVSAVKSRRSPSLDTTPEVRITLEDEVVHGLTTKNLEAEIASKFGVEGTAYVEAVRKYLNGSLVRKFGHEGAYSTWESTFKATHGRSPTVRDMEVDRSWLVVDERKLLSWTEALKKDPGLAQEMDFLGDRVVDLVNYGALNSRAYVNDLKDVMERMLRAQVDRYLPRNMVSAVKTGTGNRHLYDLEGLMVGRRDPADVSGSAKIRGKLEEEVAWDPAYLDRLGALTTEGAYMRARGLNKLSNPSSEASLNGVVHSGWTKFRVAGLDQGLVRYARDMGRDRVVWSDTPEMRHVFEAAEAARLGEDMALGRVIFPGVSPREKFWGSELGRSGGGRRFETWYNVARLLVRQESAPVQQAFDGVLFPRIIGRMPMRDVVAHSSTDFLKGLSGQFANSAVGKAIEAHGGSFIGPSISQMKEWANSPTYVTAGEQWSSRAASYLYGTHLSMSLPTVMLQLLQPGIFTVPMFGLKNYIVGVTEATKAMAQYARERGSIGLRPTDQEMRVFMDRIFQRDGVPYWEKIGMSVDFLDRSLMRIASPTQRRSWGETLMLDLPLKAFSKAEAFNRISVYHTAINAQHGALGGVKPMAGSNAWADLDDAAVQFSNLTQFGGSIADTPMAFLGYGPFGGALGNPLARMFTSFPVRTLSSFATLPRMVGTAAARDQGRATSSLEGWLLTGALAGKSLGYATVMYEVGRGMLGVDLSKGVAPGAATAVFDMSLPPAVDIPWDIATGLLGDDADTVRSATYRLLPAGVALQRLVDTMPKLPEPLGLGLQRTYVDWNTKNQQGQVPMFGADGRMVAWRNPSEVILKGVGADLGRWKNEQELTAFLLTNRQRMAEMRRTYTQAVLANDMAGAERARGAFEKAFHMPLTVSEGQWKSSIKLREVPRSERIMDSISPEVRGQYQALVAPHSGLLGMSPEAVSGFQTSTARSASGVRPESFEIPTFSDEQ